MEQSKWNNAFYNFKSPEKLKMGRPFFFFTSMNSVHLEISYQWTDRCCCKVEHNNIETLIDFKNYRWYRTRTLWISFLNWKKKNPHLQPWLHKTHEHRQSAPFLKVTEDIQHWDFTRFQSKGTYFQIRSLHDFCFLKTVPPTLNDIIFTSVLK